MLLKPPVRDFELKETDYVYEPGQFAVRGSILDVYSYSCEYPFPVLNRMTRAGTILLTEHCARLLGFRPRLPIHTTAPMPQISLPQTLSGRKFAFLRR